MNCDDLKNCLASGKPLPEAVEQHIRECTACRSMMAALSTPEEMPDPQRLEQLAKMLAASKPVCPLPSDAKMMWFALALFVAFTVAATLPFGFQGFQHLRLVQRIWYYAILALLAVLFSRATVQQMIPGSRKWVHPVGLSIGALLLFSVTAIALFPQFGLDGFVRVGIPCLRLGTACAAVSGLLASRFVRKGYAATPVHASLTVGAFAGLSGLAVLALHCTVQNASHILVWHAGTLVISGLAGAVLGNLFYRPDRLAHSMS